MEIVVGGTKQDEAPIGHTPASPHCHKENAWREHHVILWQSPPQNEKMRTKIYGCQHFEMPNVMQPTPTYFGSHLVVI